jgi:pyridoxal phosphate enzyme (YggS family)
MSEIASRLREIEARIDQAAQKTGRSLKDIGLVAVTKGVGPDKITQAYAAGIRVFGENRVQEAAAKIPQLALPDLRWHMVGHLQTNKIKDALGLFGLIESVDSPRLAKALGDQAGLAGKTADVLLEVNISGETQKYGFTPEAVYSALESMSQFPSIRVLGLMGIAPNGVGDDSKRAAFKKLKNIFSVCKTTKYDNVKMQILSMGMSDDFEIAIEEGSNWVRLGRALFGETQA